MTAANSSPQLRQSIRQQRRLLSKRQQFQHGAAVASRLLIHPWFQNANVVAFYRDTDGELSTHAMIKAARAAGKKIVLPVLHPFRHGQLLFRAWPMNASMSVNRFGIEEPSSVNPIVDVNRVDVVIVPLVGFDKHCYRIGMGGGFYDRTFAFRHINSWRKPKLIGVAHAMQEIDKVDNQAWDIAMDAVITEEAIYQR